MFATVPRMRSYGSYTRRQEQEEEKPEPGTDSTYGVRSLGSVDSGWGRDSVELEQEGEGEGEGQGQGEGVEETEDQEEHAIPQEQDQAIDLPAVEPEPAAEEWTPTIDRSTPLPQTPSPTIPQHHLSLSNAYLRERERERERDYLSEPSSPASFASMPSYMSSLSRTSSLAEPTSSHAAHTMGLGGSEELVLPTINVSQSRTRATSGARSRGAPSRASTQALKIVLLGDAVRLEAFMLGLKEVKEIVDLPSTSNQYAVIAGDDVMATITTVSSADEVESIVEDSYISLDSILHPDPSPEARHRLEDLALGYAGKSDWVHLLFVLDAEMSSVDALALLVPTLSAEPGPTSDRLLQLAEANITFPLELSSSNIPDPTPRPGSEPDGSSYFSSHVPNATASVQHLIDALTQVDLIRQASIDKFFTWRPAHTRSPATDLASSHTSHESSSAFEVAPMPTVARAQGGGEWEANLSRRLAKRRQSEDQHHQQQQQQAGGSGGARRGGKRRSSGGNVPRRHKKKAESCGPLFPFITPSDPFGSGGGGGGKRPILGEVLGGLRKRWKWGALAAAAVALVIGWNWVKSV